MKDKRRFEIGKETVNILNIKIIMFVVFHKELDYSEIAKVLNITYSTAHKNFSRLRRQMHWGKSNEGTVADIVKFYKKHKARIEEIIEQENIKIAKGKEQLHLWI